jgi:aspartyl-tRNA(Asn)/glutamyl-tRNA(Gln) amidotransferase subunit C
MSISEHDVKHIAALARVAIDDARAATLVGELNGILGHMDVLQRVELPPTIGTSAIIGMPLRDDVPGAVPLGTQREQFAPTMRDGFFLVLA